jgi:D-beta-D-heptose 7-phosphate kinase/D-beta-D-heptose 1-phosphate adenosyltransferase
MHKGLIEQLDQIGRPRVLVAGDFMLDRYVWGKVERISPEAPVQVLNVRTEDVRPGGAANVALNARSLGADVVCVGSVGADAAGRQLTAALVKQGIRTAGLVADRGRTTPVKTRLLAHNQQMLRMDSEEIVPLSAALSRRLARTAEHEMRRCDIILVSDYAKGSLSPELVKSMIEDARKSHKPVLIDPKGLDFSKYRGATAITPNLRETELVTGMTLARGDIRALRSAAKRLLSTLNLEFLLITRGENGISLFARQGRTEAKRNRHAGHDAMSVFGGILEIGRAHV